MKKELKETMDNIGMNQRMAKLYAEIAGLKKDSGLVSKARKEGLMKEKGYAELMADLDELRLVKRGTELAFDQKEPGYIDQLDALKEKVQDKTADLLTEALLIYHKTGQMPMFTSLKNGKPKKLRVEFKIGFKQETLF